MPKPDESSHGDLKRLDQRLDAFEAGRAGKSSIRGMGGASDGYRLLGEMLGGVLGGLGLGWLIDRLAHTTPWGVLGGLLIGAGMSVYATVRTASRIAARSKTNLGPIASVPDDDEDET